MSTNKVNINTLIDEAKFTPFHWGVLLWCLLIIIFLGYDLVIYGVALPLLMQEWSLSAVAGRNIGQYCLVRDDVWCHEFRNLIR